MNVLLISDMLRDFVDEDGALYCGTGVKKIIPFIAEKAEECRHSDCKVIYMCDSHKPDDPEFKMFRPHCVEGTAGARICEELKPHEGDLVIKKNTFSSFYGTRLEDVLKKLAPEIVCITGVCTSICVMDAVGDLRNRGYRVVVYADGVADLDARAHEFALKRMKDIYGAEII